MTTVEFMVNGRNITVDENEFWNVYNQLKEIADAENVRCSVDAVANEYCLTEDQIDDCVEYICDDVIKSTEESFDEHVLYYIGEYLSAQEASEEFLNGSNSDDDEENA